jgi:hypothetical protein
MSRASLPGTPLELPLPPELAEAFGYSGDSRFVGFYWSPCGDEVIHTDGRSTGTGQSWTFLSYRRHRAVSPLLDGWNLGYSDQDAEHCLLLDRERNRASIATLTEARAFLEDQHPPMPELTPEEAAAIRERIEQVLEEWRSREVDPAELRRLMDEQRGRVKRMVAFLDKCPVPPAAGQMP